MNFFFLFLCACLLFQDISAVPCPLIDQLPWIQGKDQEAINYAAPFLPNDPIILEAGVCGAEDTCRFKQQWPNSVIYGFEAHPDQFRRAMTNVQGLRGIFLFNLALFDKVGKITFYISRVHSGASSVLRDNLRNIENVFNIPKENLTYNDVPTTVKCTTIDHWAKETKVSKIDYIWLDVEGAEFQILKNAQTILPTVKAISIEVNFQEFREKMTLFPKLYDFLTDNGFILKYIWGNPRWQASALFVQKSTESLNDAQIKITSIKCQRVH